MTPDAGTSGEVSTNRGMVFIPEVGDHVMLGFRYNDPNRPFVLGSLFNGTTGAGGQSQNHLKSIFTRGGSTITFNELETSILVSLVFNTGPEFLNTGGKNNGETQIKKKINNKEYEAGADEMSDVTNGGTSGLVKRRKAEINIFKNNVYDSTH